jgi:hypothetical protein
MILDQSDEEKRPTPRRNLLRRLESLLISSIFLAALFKVLHLNYAYELSSISWGALGLIYLFGFYWIDTPLVVNRRTTWITILYGVSFFLAVFAPAIIEFLPEYNKQITAAVIIIFISINYVDRYWSPDDTQVATTRTYIRMIVFSAILILGIILHLRHF